MNCHRGGRVMVIKLGHALDQTHPVHHAMVYMAQRLKEKSDGSLRIDIYPSQQLGDERELLELLQIGSLEMAKVSASIMEGFTPVYKALSLPYMYRDEA
ncbi:MAG: TRAP transporter substrate-binding protein DctP, partial [Fidelibacterota bacterium]